MPLDAETERACIERFLGAAGGRIVLWIMPRLTYLDRMDEILVLRDNRIMERGTHRQLLSAHD